MKTEIKYGKKLTNKFIKRIFLWTSIYTFIFIILWLLCRSICSSVIWYEGDFFYDILRNIGYSFTTLLIIWLIGFSIIVIKCLYKTLSYVDSIVDASALLISDKEEDIVLPEDLLDVEKRMNQIKKQARKRLTQLFPFLLPLRVWQRNLFYQIGMRFDGNKYSKNIGENLKYEICKSKTLMINENSGHDIIYQKNKVENLKIANQTMNHILIYPNETFFFYYLVRNSRKYGSYKDGLILVDGKIVAKKGGGICHLSNLLYYLFLMSPLTVVERHGHKIKSFPNPDKSSLEGIDATISSGWLDLKVKNETNNIYQIDISFDENYMYGKILSDKESTIDYKIVNGNLNYIKENNKIYECVEVIRIEIDKKTKKEIKKEKLYDEKVLIKYELPSDVKVEEM